MSIGLLEGAGTTLTTPERDVAKAAVAEKTTLDRYSRVRILVARKTTLDRYFRYFRRLIRHKRDPQARSRTATGPVVINVIGTSVGSRRQSLRFIRQQVTVIYLGNRAKCINTSDGVE